MAYAADLKSVAGMMSRLASDYNEHDTWPTQTWLRIRYPVTRNASVRFLRLRHPVTRDATRRGPREVATCEGDCARRSRRPPRPGLAQISLWSRPAFHSRTRIGHRRTASRADPRRRGDFDGVCSRRVRSLDPRRRTAGTRLKQSGGPRQSARRQAPADSGHGPWRSRPVPRPASPIGITPVVVGQGKKHGRYWLDDGVLDSTQVPSLSQIRAETPSGGPAIRQRPSPSQQKIVALEAENKRLNEEVANHAKQLAEIKAFLQSQNGGGALFSPHASPSQSTVGSNNPPQLQAGDRSMPSPGHARQIASPDD